MRILIEVFKWWFFRGILLKFNTLGFQSSIFSFADSESSFDGFNNLTFGTVVKNTSVGKYTYIAGARIQSTRLGRFCSIGPRSRIGGLGRHPTEWISTHPIFFSTLKQANISFCERDFFDECGEVSIGNDVWIGANAFVLDGISIGDGAIVAAGAVVTKDVEPYSIVGGVPARLIRYRFTQTQIKSLQEMAWWNWPEDLLRKNAVLFRKPVDETVLNDLQTIYAQLKS